MYFSKSLSNVNCAVEDNSLDCAVSRIDIYSAVVFLSFLFLLTIGPTPFKEGSGLSIDKSGAGEWLRQVILLTLCALALPIFFVKKKQLLLIASSSCALVGLYSWAALSVFWSSFLEIAFHRFVGTFICALITLVGASLPPRYLVRVLIIFTGVIMLINYAGVFFIPHLALDPDGLWKGLHLQKNVAGYFSAISSLTWLFLGFRRKTPWLIIGGLLWMVFLWFTHSKTSFGMYLVTFILGFMLSIGFSKGFNRAIFVFCIMFVFFLVPLWIYVLEVVSLAWLGNSLFSVVDFTFTGRTEIWNFVWTFILQTPIAGTGYGSFWAVGDWSPALLSASDFVAQYTEAHNGYIDVLVTLGFVGLILLAFSLAQAYYTLSGYIFQGADSPVSELLLVCALILTFGTLLNSLESTVLQGLSPVWTLMLLSLWVIKCRSDNQPAASQNGKYQKLIGPKE